MNITRSQTLFAQSQTRIAGGVNSPVRSFRSVGKTPRFIARGDGAHLTDVDGNRYIDYVCSWGAQILGHADPDVTAAVADRARAGLGFGAPTETEYEFADLICTRLPSVERLRAVSSGTEATMSAVRLARGFTGKDRIVKFAGCYHGHSDCLLVAGGSGILTHGTPACAGVPEAVVQHTAVLPFNHAQAVRDYFADYGNDTAAVIVEPIAGNMNLVKGESEFLQTLRDCCSTYGSVLIFDEVMSGFRVAPAGAQGLLGIRPDLTCLGKVIGGGLNVAAFGGRKDIMAHLAPDGEVYQAGTLAGNPVALAAGIATLKKLDEKFYTDISAITRQLADGLTQAAQSAGANFCAQSVGAMFGIYFSKTVPTNFARAQQTDTEKFKTFFHQMLEHGIYFAPSPYEAGFTTASHTPTEIQTTLTAAQKTLSSLNQN